MKLILTCFASLLLMGCGEMSSSKSHSLQRWEELEVTVTFRRDMLGAAGAPIGPTTTWLNNSMVSLDGKIVEANAEGIFLDSHHKANSSDKNTRHSTFWIPTESILTVRLEAK